MASRQYASKRLAPEERLDARWLLGDEPARPTRSLFRRTVFCLFVAGVVVWSWPYASKRWLQFQFANELRNAQTSDEAIQSVTKLAQLLPMSLLDLTDAFQKNDEESTRLAYQYINGYVDEVAILPKEKRSAALQTLAIALERSKEKYSPAGRLLAGALAVRLRESTLQGTDLISIQVTRCAESILASANERQNPPGLTDETLPSLASTSKNTRSLRDLGDPLDLESVPSEPESSIEVDSGIDQAPPKIPNQQPTLAQGSLSDRNRSSHASSSDQGDSAPASNRMPVNSLRLPTDENEGNAGQHPIVVAKPTLSHASSTDFATVKEASSQQETSFTQPLNSLEVDTDSRANIQETIEGMDRLDAGSVVKLLSSVVPEKANAATMELQRRGMSRQHLEMAVQIARGDSRARIETLDRMIQSGWNAIPYLTWMGEEGDLEVRTHAIQLLGSVADPQAAKELRYLLQRERDEELAAQIKQILVLRGSFSSLSSERRLIR